MDERIDTRWSPDAKHNTSREIKITRPGPRTGPSPVFVAVVVAQVVVGVVAGVVADWTAMAGVVVELAVAAEQTAAVADSWRDPTAKAAASEVEVAARGWPDARVVSVHTQPGTTSSGIVIVEVVAVDSVVSAFGPGRLRHCCSGGSWVVGRLSFRSETDSGFGEVWRAA